MSVVRSSGRLGVVLAVLGLTWPALAVGETKNPQGEAPAAKELTPEEIIRTAYEHNGAAYENVKANLTMTLTNLKGERKTRDLEIRSIRNAEGLVRTILRFRSPADLAGTAFLVMANKSGPPDQYLYLSNLKKVRRIAGGQTSQSFMGTDFTFLDMSPVPAVAENDVSYARLPDTKIGGQDVYVAEVKPRIQGAPYSRVVIYVQKEFMLPIKAEFYDATGAQLKVLSVKKLKKLKGPSGDKMVPLETEMRNVQKGSTTTMLLENVDAESKLDPAEFQASALEQ